MKKKEIETPKETAIVMDRVIDLAKCVQLNIHMEKQLRKGINDIAKLEEIKTIQALNAVIEYGIKTYWKEKNKTKTTMAKPIEEEKEV